MADDVRVGASEPSARYDESLRPLVLKPAHTPIGRFVINLLIAALANGLIGTFVWHLVTSFREGHEKVGFELVLEILLLFFLALVGLAFLFGVPYSFLALWNPRPHLTLGHSTLRLGDTIPLEWSFTGIPGRLRRFHITLVGEEIATASEGPSWSWPREVFRTLEIFDATEPWRIEAGSAKIEIPAADPPSLASESRQVVWTLKVAGDIRFWPNVDESFELTVLPQAMRRDE